jgi:hypothetical protein
MKELQYEYWGELLTKIKGKSDKLFQNINPIREYWLASRGYGIGGLIFEFVLLKDHTKVQLSTTKEIFDKLSEYKAEIDEIFAGELSWERLDDSKGSRIVCYFNEEVSIRNRDDWGKMIDWQVENMIKLENAFKEPIEKLKNQQNNG